MFNLTNFDDDFFHIFPKGGKARRNKGGFQAWGLQMDLTETTESFKVVVNIPGAEKEDVKINHEEQVLTITVDHKEEIDKEEDKDGVKVHWKERKSGFLTRSISLPENCDLEKARAEQKNGVLTITIPKKEVKDAKEKKYIDII